ncbi:hypothetical protein FK178_02640 [Antarcticibacterium arcticum]|uniref:Uncharacterized protein n=1 Tax=Antarcticibacterium arcticum TaxID=2585771 RepID=A0A5B8YIL5_9FLAO|nr:hypothetical protein [Antarcticibacterium arcticum]QED36677.1 hypothetical protein FK178_02640 [Antarcticibacterium arcticum]
MKYLSLFFRLSLTLSIQAGNYECTMSGIQFFPQQKEISLNPMFIVEGYAYSQPQIEALGTREVYLETDDGEKIILELKGILRGQMMLTQAIFKPVQSLLPNRKYYLKLSAKPDEDILKNFNQRYNPLKKEDEMVYWETTGLQNAAPLDKNLKIVFAETNVQFYGCGPEANAIFNISEKANAQIWFKTEVMDLTTGKLTTYYIQEWKGKLYVGHNMCSGAFTYNKKGNYKVRFTPMNIDGRELNTTSWTTFASPYLNAEDPWGF